MSWQFWLQVAPIAVFLVFGFTIGGIVERRHFRRLRRREDQLGDIMVTDVKTLPAGCAARPFGLVSGQVVIASDYFKTFAAGLRKLIGGDLRTYETLMERARREALVRMVESARQMGANRVLNVRFATSNIGSGTAQRRRRGAAMVEMYAYGTAVYVPPDSKG